MRLKLHLGPLAHVLVAALCSGRLAGSKSSPLRPNFSEFLDDVCIPQSANGKKQEAGVRDCIGESNSNCVQTLGRLVVDVTSNASDMVFAEIGVPDRKIISSDVNIDGRNVRER